MDLKYVYYRMDMTLPRSVLRMIKALLPQSFQERWDPFLDYDYKWPLRGPLSGCVLRFPEGAAVRYMLSRKGPVGRFVTTPNTEPRVCAAIQRMVEPGMNCVDVGAHIGYMTLLLAKNCAPSGKVFAFEALPDNAKRIRENMGFNGLVDRVIVENFAVSHGNAQKIILHEGNTTFTASLMQRPGFTSEKIIEVPSIALDDYFPRDLSLGFVKMDIEGAEGQAVCGMTRILQVQRPICLIEIHGEPGMLAAVHLVSAGYVLFDLDDHPLEHVPQSDSPVHIVAKPSENAS